MKTLKDILLSKNDGEILGQKPKQPLRKTAEEWKKQLYKGFQFGKEKIWKLQCRDTFMGQNIRYLMAFIQERMKRRDQELKDRKIHMGNNARTLICIKMNNHWNKLAHEWLNL